MKITDYNKQRLILPQGFFGNDKIKEIFGNSKKTTQTSALMYIWSNSIINVHHRTKDCYNKRGKVIRKEPILQSVDIPIFYLYRDMGIVKNKRKRLIEAVNKCNKAAGSIIITASRLEEKSFKITIDYRKCKNVGGGIMDLKTLRKLKSNPSSLKLYLSILTMMSHEQGEYWRKSISIDKLARELLSGRINYGRNEIRKSLAIIEENSLLKFEYDDDSKRSFYLI